jgi:hypothetical protein
MGRAILLHPPPLLGHEACNRGELYLTSGLPPTSIVSEKRKYKYSVSEAGSVSVLR